MAALLGPLCLSLAACRPLCLSCPVTGASAVAAFLGWPAREGWRGTTHCPSARPSFPAPCGQSPGPRGCQSLVAWPPRESQCWSPCMTPGASGKRSLQTSEQQWRLRGCVPRKPVLRLPVLPGRGALVSGLWAPEGRDRPRSSLPPVNAQEMPVMPAWHRALASSGLALWLLVLNSTLRCRKGIPGWPCLRFRPCPVSERYITSSTLHPGLHIPPLEILFFAVRLSLNWNADMFRKKQSLWSSFSHHGLTRSESIRYSSVWEEEWMREGRWHGGGGGAEGQGTTEGARGDVG